MFKKRNKDSHSKIIRCEGLPVDYGLYFFLLPNGMIREGMYDSYPHPVGTAIKVCCDYTNEYFTYYDSSEIIGYIQKINV